ncbi:MAG: nuclear transport factor 2 family protein [Candidatus Eremiobacteraeota bacterium]|nr:nuclear transport factor 2 family protein [Candidatus Eremiobacteraeota bacterium]MCW5865923.1 nuclear transport factor 2 family protein [Candidatus Eremiobacteraeota bacterium]
MLGNGGNLKEEPSNYQVQRSFFDRVWHQEEERAIYDLFDGEAGGIDPVQGVNPDTYRPWYRGMLRHLGGVRIEIVHFLEQDDRLALKFVLRGTARKSGRPVIWKGSTFGRYGGGKIVGGSNYLDHLSLFSQLDLLPEQAMHDALADESLFWQLELDPQLKSLSGVPALFVYRIVQEALRNVARHGGTRQAEVHLLLEGDCLRGIIQDQGIGFEVTKPSAGLGLAGMKERCALLHGNLSISSQPGRGTRIDFRLPRP